ncbi:TonB-dependent receptor domain-containing protein [Mangrovitalea sediminis]|uniref:TonB-dependent receptor domain-containing protein n=1 Tax=Mangrovitalea sediminis TaxID=1982043 RepID=UPI001D0D00E2|nr:TonB-dependent receptor [Mangrovitalea sediminis]
MRKPWAEFCLIGLTLHGATAWAGDTNDSTSPAQDPLLIKITGGHEMPATPAAVTATPVETLRDNPAVSLSRMGGLGTDPVVRGMSQDRVRVLLDGVEVPGACPNRMDPPSSRISTALTQDLQVETETRTLRWGPLYGGQIMATTPAPKFADGSHFSGHASMGGYDNGNGKQASLSAAAGTSTDFIRAAGGWSKADDYKDGDGNEVRSAFTRREGQLDGAWQGANGVRVAGQYSRQEERDVKYAGTGMDSPKTNTDIYRAEISAPLASGQWQLTAWQTNVDHIMDNFSLRPLTSAMKMLTRASADTRGARWVLDQSFNDNLNWSTGFDVQTINRNAERFSGSQLQNLQSLLWPDVQRDRYGLYLEAFWRIQSSIKLSGGVRYDHVRMDANRAHDNLGMATPAMLYQRIYQTGSLEAIDDNWSGFIGGDWTLSPWQTLSLTFSRSVRSPDATERYLASWGMSSAMRWVGNPALATEKHHKVDLALNGSAGAWHWRPSVWLDKVQDYVLRTQLESGTYAGTSVYRNVRAQLHGAELSVGWGKGAWAANSALAYVFGENLTDHRPLPQIPPLSLVESLAWHHKGHQVRVEWVVAQAQHRVDTASGQDPGPSNGYGVINLSGEHPLARHLSLSWAVDNLFDKTWAPNVSRANSDPFSPEAVRVNEPGRTLHVALNATW